MRLLVRCGMERDDGASFRTEETVPGVRPRWSATALSVTAPDFLGRSFLSLGIDFQCNDSPAVRQAARHCTFSAAAAPARGEALYKTKSIVYAANGLKSFLTERAWRKAASSQRKA